MRVPYSLEEVLALSPHLLRTFYGSLQSMSRASRLSREAALRRDAQAARLSGDTSI
jgi:hypothetical protein